MRSGPAPPDGLVLTDEVLERILELVAVARGLDLLDYRRPALAARVSARMGASGLHDGAAYLEQLRHDPKELERLSLSLPVHWTSFFRDPEVFAALDERVLPRLLAEAPAFAPVRAWVVGAATGEEAYSLAMLLTRACEARGRSCSVLATDRAPHVLEVARAGRYPTAALAGVPDDLRARSFEPCEGGLRAREGLRAKVSFVAHDLLEARLAPREAVVPTFDLVLCRNVLLYFDDRFQERALARLGAVVRAGGALVLGRWEHLRHGVSHRFESFPDVETSLRIFRRLA